MPDDYRSFRRSAAAPLGSSADLRSAQRPDARDVRLDQRRDQRPAQRPYQQSDQRSDQRSDPRSDQRFEQRLDQWIATGRQLVDGVAGARPGSRANGRPQPGGRAGGLSRPGGLGRWVEEKLDWLLEDDDAWREPWEGAALGQGGRATEPAWGQPDAGSGSAANPAPWANPGPGQDNAWARGSTEPPPGPESWSARASRPASRQSLMRQPPGPDPDAGPGVARWPEPSAASPKRPSPLGAAAGPGAADMGGGQAPGPSRRRLEALSRRATPLLPPRSPGGAASEPGPDWSQEWPDDASFSVPRWQRPPGPDRQAQAPLPLQPSLRPAPGGPGPGPAQTPAQAMDSATDPAPHGDPQAGPAWGEVARPGPAQVPSVGTPVAGFGRPVPRSTRRRQGS